jgi:hypothetical protein
MQPVTLFAIERSEMLAIALLRALTRVLNPNKTGINK